MSRIILNLELKEFDATSLDGTFQNWGSVLSNPAIKVVMFNTSDVDAYVSKDGSTNWARLPAGSAMTLDESTLPVNGVDAAYYLSEGAQLTVKQVTGAGSSGNLIAMVVTRELP